MKTKTRYIKLNAQSQIGYFYMGEIGRNRKKKEYNELLDGIKWRTSRLFDSINNMGITCEELVNDKNWKESIKHYIKAEIKQLKSK